MELSSQRDAETVIAIFTILRSKPGIWWMDCTGLNGADRFEQIVRRHPHVVKVLSGHVHRTIQTNWAGCSLWVSPSTSVVVVVDLHPDHDPAETSESPAFSLHAHTGKGIVSHVVPVGATATRSPIEAGTTDVANHARPIQTTRDRLFE